ncbi:uncharacterized protein LOC141853188 [Brevipalpus obovatus]|uniref:uncharacterized protein LOC141853188 n=1 Tax=Brevipalpus obovatus TaxID=246614 RepID=UPI003D9DFD79
MPEYHYISLKDLSSQRDDSQLHNVYGVIRKFQAQGVCLRDETINILRLELTGPCEPIIEYIKTGDIMRIHRVRATSNSSQFLCMKATDFVIFTSFKDKDSPSIAIKTIATNPTLDGPTYKRFQELESWFSQQLLQVSLSTIKVPGWVDLVCRIIDVKNFGPRSVLIVTDGTRVSSGVKFKWSLRDYESDDEILADLVTITVWDKHAIKAKKFKKDDIVVLYNLEVAEPRGLTINLNGPNDRTQMLDLNLRGGSHHGKCIRSVHKNSILGIAFSRGNSRQPSSDQQSPSIGRPERLESNGRRVGLGNISPVLVPSEDQISITSETSISETQPKHSSTMVEDSDIDRSAKIPIRQVITCATTGDGGSRGPNKSKRLKPQPEIDFPMFLDMEFPPDSWTIRQYLDCKTSELQSIRARVENLETINSKDRSEPVNYIVCVCPTCGYNEPIFREQLENIKKHQPLTCHDCLNASRSEQLALHLRASLTLTDENTRIKALLGDVDFELVIGLTAMDILTDKSASRKFIDFLEFIFPPLINTSQGISDKRFFKWLISSGDQKNFKINSVKRITESSA